MIMTSHKKSLWRRLLLGFTLALGFGTAWFTIVLWLSATLLEPWWTRSHGIYESLEVAADGTPYIQRRQLDNMAEVSYRDLEGQAHLPLERDDQLPAETLALEHATEGAFFMQPDWPQRIKLFIHSREPTVLWYFVHDGQVDGSGYFEGYDCRSNRRIGFIGLSGPRDQPVPIADRIPVRATLLKDYGPWNSFLDGSPGGRYWLGTAWTIHEGPHDLPSWLVHVPSGSKLRVVDLAARTVKTAFEAPEPIESVSVPYFASRSVGKVTRPRPILVATRETIYKLDHQYHLIGTFPIPIEIDRKNVITWYPIEDGRAVALATAKRAAADASDPPTFVPMLYQVTKDGTIQNSRELHLETGSSHSEMIEFFLMSLGLPAPAIVVLIAWLRIFVIPPTTVTAGTVLQAAWPWMLIILAIAIGLAALTWRRARAFGVSRRERMVWTIFVLLFGLPAWVGFRLHRRWLPRVPCQHCQARAPRDREACAECGEPFPASPLRGNEIFA